jgi:DNA excision repair protein ERCC-4
VSARDGSGRFLPKGRKGSRGGPARQRALVVDTREKTPFQFPGYRVKRIGLPTGDYSVEGFEDSVAVERKSGQDFVNTLLVNYNRFKAELKRGQDMRVFVVVVECSMASLLLSVEGRTGVGLRPLLARIAVLAAESKTPILFCDNRAMAEAVTLEILRPYIN